MKSKRLIILAGIAGLAWFVYAQFLGDILTLENFREQQAEITDWVAQNPFVAAAGFFAFYVAITAVNIPGAALLTLITGVLFAGWLLLYIAGRAQVNRSTWHLARLPLQTK